MRLGINFKNSFSTNISVVFCSLQSTHILKTWVLLQFYSAARGNDFPCYKWYRWGLEGRRDLPEVRQLTSTVTRVSIEFCNDLLSALCHIQLPNYQVVPLLSWYLGSGIWSRYHCSCKDAVVMATNPSLPSSSEWWKHHMAKYGHVLKPGYWGWGQKSWRPCVPLIQHIGHDLSHAREKVGCWIEQSGVIVHLPKRASTDQMEQGRPKWRWRFFPFSLSPSFLFFFILPKGSTERIAKENYRKEFSDFSEPKNHWGT